MSGNTNHPPLTTERRHRRRVILLPLLLVWPAVGLLGALLSHLTGSTPLAAMLPMLWLLVLAFVIERMHVAKA